MAPTLFSTFPLRWRFFRRLAALLAMSTMLIVAAGSAIGAVDAPRPVIGEAAAVDADAIRAWVNGDLPDLEFLIAGVPPSDPAIADLVGPAVRELPGVSSAVIETLVNGRTAVHVSLDATATGDVAASVRSSIERLLPQAQVSVGGRDVVDRDVTSRLNRGAILATVPVLLVLFLSVSGAVGARLGLATAGSVGLATLLAGAAAGRVAGSFDGSLATTSLPSVVVALLLSSVLAFRLLEWFKHPEGGDQAEAIRLSVRHLLPEVGLFFGALGATALVTEIAGAARSTATVILVAALIAAFVTLGVLPAILATMSPVPNDDGYQRFQVPTPDGRHFPAGVLLGFAAVLVLLGLFSMRTVDARLLDTGALPERESSRRVAEQLMQSGGDPSDAIVAVLPAQTSPNELQVWAESVSADPVVGWVETATGRYEGGALVVASVDGASLVTNDGYRALVVPLVSGRSEAAQQLVLDIEALPGLSAVPILSGVPVDAQQTADTAVGTLWLLVGLLAISSAAAVWLLMRDLTLAFYAAGLHVLGSTAALGVFHLIAESASGSELQVLALVVNLGVLLFELGFLRRIALARPDLETRDAAVSHALRHEGRASMLGLGLTAVLGVGFLLGDLEIARRLGVAIAAGLVIESLIGVWLLRPVVLGVRAARLRAGVVEMERQGGSARSLPALGTGSAAPVDPNPPIRGDDTDWRRIVGGLLRAEFECQTFPEDAALETVFVEGTPLYEEVAAHNRRLVDTGLRITGRGPRIHSITAVNPGSPVTLSMVVDHPPRYLINANGRQIGQRPSARREGMLWLVQDPSGRYRIAEAIDLGPVAEEPSPVTVEESSVKGTIPILI